MLNIYASPQLWPINTLHDAPSPPAYRRRRTLTDSVLLALADPACTALDLWGCGTMLSDKALRRAICGMPDLKVHF